MLLRILQVVTVVAWAVLAGRVEADAVAIALVDGTTVTGELGKWTSGSVLLTTADGPREFPRSQLLDIRWERDSDAAAAAAPNLRLELVDGTALPIESFAAAGRMAQFASPLADKSLKLSAERIRRVELQPTSDAIAGLWRQLDERQPAGDVLLVANRDGTKLDYLTGVVGDVTTDNVAFEYDGQQLNIKRPRVAGIQYYHAEPPRLPEPLCTVALVTGASVPVRTLEAADGQLRIVTPAGLRLTMPLNQLARADYSAGKLSYLSDLEPTETKWTPRVAVPAGAALLANYGLPRKNASFAGSALTLSWANDSEASGREIRTYVKGLAVRSRTEATWRLPPGMNRFTATAGIDPATASEGHVMLEIRADDRVLWEGEIDGTRDPVQIEVELKSAHRLQIRVDYGRNLDFGDCLHLVDARVTK
jgi:hypothetical protein